MVSFRATRQEHLDYKALVDAIPETKIAWFGGWVSADGCVGSDKTKPVIKFTLTDLDPLQEFSALFGNKIHGPYPQRGLGTKPTYHWQISGWKARYILVRLAPWLSARYTERAAINDDWEPREHAGRKLEPADIVAIKGALSTGKHGVGRQLAKQYNVTEGMISSIKVGRTWATTTEEVA